MTTKKKETKKAVSHSKPTTAAAILGRPVTKTNDEPRPPVKIKPEWQKYYTRLLELREQLVRQMNGLAKESAEEIAGYSLHMALT